MSALDSIDHLRDQAQSDLQKPYTGVSLNWAMYVAHFSGQLRSAEHTMGFVEHLFRDARSTLATDRMDATDPRLTDRLRELAELQVTITRTRQQVARWQEMLRAAELTSQLIDRRINAIALKTGE